MAGPTRPLILALGVALLAASALGAGLLVQPSALAALSNAHGPVTGASGATSAASACVISAFPSGANVTTRDGNVPAALTGGVLRIEAPGDIALSTWNKSAYQVQVVTEGPSNAYVTHVHPATDGGVFSLTVRVAPASQSVGPLGLAVFQQHADAQVHVMVPALAYQGANLTNQPFGGIQVNNAPPSVNVTLNPPATSVSRNGSNLSVGSGSHRFVVQNLQASSVAVSTPNGDLCLAGIQATTLLAESNFGDVALSNVTAATTAVGSAHGNVALASFAGTTLTAWSDYGDISGRGLSVGQMNLTSSQGDVTLASVGGTTLKVWSGYGDIGGTNRRVDQIDLTASQGGVTLASVGGTTLKAWSGYGDIAGTDLRFANANVSSSQGDVHLALTPTASGLLSVTSGYGDVSLMLPAAHDLGYDVNATSNHGNATVDLPNATTTHHGNTTQGGTSAQARTVGFADRPIQVQVRAASDYGNVAVLVR